MCVCFRQRNELQGKRQSPFRGGRCLPVWHAQGRVGPRPAWPRGQAEFHQEPIAGPISANGQQVGNEAIRQQEGAYERENSAKSRGSLGHPSLLQFSVSDTFSYFMPYFLMFMRDWNLCFFHTHIIIFFPQNMPCKIIFH